MTGNIQELIRSVSRCEIITDSPAKDHTSFRIGGPVRLFCSPRDETDLASLLGMLEKERIPHFPLGRGTNMLFPDEGCDAVAVCPLKYLNSIRVLPGNRIEAGAGALLSSVAHTAMVHGLDGMAFAHGIPGSVGGAMRMNAGAYGHNLSDVTECVYAFINGNIECLNSSDMEFGYRSSILTKNWGFVSGAVFQLTPGDPRMIQHEINDLNQRRRSSQPLEFPSAGSFFKRPEGYYAGALIEQAGLKGYRIGDAQVSEKHAGFIINLDRASCSDVLRLRDKIQQEVFMQFGVRLETEVCIVNPKGEIA